LPALFGVWLYKVVQGDLQAAEEVAYLLVTTGEANADDDMRIEGYWALGDVQFWQGNLADAHENIHKTIRLYDRERFQHHGARFSQDPMVAAECYLSFVYAIQGKAEEAHAASARALTLARDLNHAFSVGWALGFRSTVAYFLDDPEAAIAHADTAMQFYKEQRFPFFITSCQATKGWGLCRRGQVEEGLALIRSALANMKLIGSELVLPLFMGLLAESLLLAGEHTEAMAAAQEGLAATVETGSRLMQTHLHRIVGDILLANPVRDYTAARNAFTLSARLAEQCQAGRFSQVVRDRLDALEARIPQTAN
jgi:predicted ATPase